MKSQTHLAGLLSDAASEGIDNRMDMDVSSADLGRGAGDAIADDLQEIIRFELDRIAKLFSKNGVVSLIINSDGKPNEACGSIMIYPTGRSGRYLFARGASLPEAIAKAEQMAADYVVSNRTMTAADIGMGEAA